MSSQARIVKLSNWLYWLVNATLAALPFALIWVFSQAWARPEWVSTLFADLPPETILDPSKSVAVTVIGCIMFLPLLLAILQMRGLFDRYRHHEILTNACARHISRIGQWLMVTSVLALLLPTLQMLALTYDNPPGTRMLTIGISSNTVAVFLIAGLLTVIGWALSDAAQIADENASFI